MNCKFLVRREEINEISVVETFMQLFRASGSLILCNRVLFRFKENFQNFQQLVVI